MNKITTTTLPDFLDGRGIGFGRMFNLIDEAVAYNSNTNYPPYNVIQIDDDNFLIEIALAGFELDDLTITQCGNKLSVDGTTPVTNDETLTYLHKGIGNRKFSREFVLADHVVIDGAEFENGIVSIKLHRELPEEMRPRLIDIKRIGR